MNPQDHPLAGGVLIGVAIVLSTFAQLFMKAGMQMLPGLEAAIAGTDMATLVSQWWPMAAWVVSGLFLYGLSMVCWFLVLAKFELSFAYPLLSLGYALVYIGAVLWPRLGETVSLSKSVGIVLIVVGVVLVTRSK